MWYNIKAVARTVEKNLCSIPDYASDTGSKIFKGKKYEKKSLTRFQKKKNGMKFAHEEYKKTKLKVAKWLEWKVWMFWSISTKVLNESWIC